MKIINIAIFIIGKNKNKLQLYFHIGGVVSGLIGDHKASF